MEKYSIGIDIGSTSAKTVVVDENKNIVFTNLQPTGWSSIETAEGIRKLLIEEGFDPAGAEKVIATGYGRI
ncbi:MAG: CoA activase, partial [Firmicutes bacterium]|nr:CoA activase [Bacillota bacterium]